MDAETTKPMITQSIPVVAEKALFAFGKTVVNSISTVYGATMVGALGVSNNLGGITTNPQNGFQEGASAIISVLVIRRFKKQYLARDDAAIAM